MSNGHEIRGVPIGNDTFRFDREFRPDADAFVDGEDRVPVSDVTADSQEQHVQRRR